MKFVLIFWPQAVGKMSVWQEIEKMTDFKLFHNHVSIEFVAPYLNYSSELWKALVRTIRKKVFEAVAKSDLEWFIYTTVWEFDQASDTIFIENLCEIFRSQWAEIYLIELEASQDIRKERNTHPHRLSSKPTKKNLEWSERDLLESDKNHRLNSLPGEIQETNYMKLNNESLTPSEVSERVCEYFWWHDWKE